MRTLIITCGNDSSVLSGSGQQKPAGRCPTDIRIHTNTNTSTHPTTTVNTNTPFQNLPYTNTERYTARFLARSLGLFVSVSVSVSVAALYLSPPRFGTSTDPRTPESSSRSATDPNLLLKVWKPASILYRHPVSETTAKGLGILQGLTLRCGSCAYQSEGLGGISVEWRPVAISGVTLNLLAGGSAWWPCLWLYLEMSC